MVMIEYLYVLKLLAALGCGLIAGVFFAFSTFVMKAPAQHTPAQGIAAMQFINVMVINPWFMTAFFSTSVVYLVLIVSSLLQRQQPNAVYWLANALFYLIGCFGGTMVFNIPLNDALAVAHPNDTEGVNLWARYLTNWTFWNHVRAIAAFIAAALFTMAISTSQRF